MPQKGFKRVKGKRFQGVYSRKSSRRLLDDGSPDIVFGVSYYHRQMKKQVWKTIGWYSEGVTPEIAKLELEKLKLRSVEKKYVSKDIPTFEEVFEKHYLPYVQESKKTWKDDESLYKNWLHETFGHLKLDKIHVFLLDKLKKKMKDSGRAPATIRAALQLIRRIFNFAIERGLFDGKNPTKGYEFPKFDNKRIRYLSKEEAEYLLSKLKQKSETVYRIACFSLLTGMRLGEILNLTWQDINLNEKLITIRDTKNGETRFIPISPRLMLIINEMSPKNRIGYIFTTKQGKKISDLSKTFQRVVDSIGLNNNIEEMRNKVTFHTLRHTFASWAVIRGIPLYDVSKALGHKSLQMTMRYAHLSPDKLKIVTNTVAEHLSLPK